MTLSPLTLRARVAATLPERVEVFYRPAPDPDTPSTWLLRRDGRDIRVFQDFVAAEKWAEQAYGCWTWGYAYPGHYVAITT